MRRRYRIAAVFALVLTLPIAAMAYADQDKTTMTEDVVAVDTGKIRGAVHQDHRSFQGIPYASPPLGDLRWSSPTPPAAWEDVRDATEPGSPCPQLATDYGGEDVLEEDCLFLNVTTPRQTDPAQPLPVIVWIHGNGSIGSGDVFEAAALAEQGQAIVVTINYRMGVFGAFGHPELADSGTLGIQDQRAALEWVQRNVAAFGGDGGNVSLFGVSFGATAIAAHLASPRSQPLFHKAIMHSGFSMMDLPAGALYPEMPAMEWFGWKSEEEVWQQGEQVAGELGCDAAAALECLRGKSVKELLEYPSIMNIFQTYAYGGDELPQVPARALQEGEFADIPVLAGSTGDEHRTFTAIRIMSGFPIEDDSDYTVALQEAFGDRAAAVEREYPLSDYDNAAVAFSTVMTDRMWSQATYRQNEALSQKSPVYFYEFADRNPPEEFPFPPELAPGAYHNADISYLLRSPEFAQQLTPPQVRLSNDMIEYWSNFARNGDPNAPELPNWPRFDTDAHVQSLAPGESGIGGVDYTESHRLDFWRRPA